MKLIARLHPELRRRAKSRAGVRQRRWRQEVDQWFDHDRSAQLAKNRALQAVEPGALDDVELAAHISSVLSHFEQSARRNLATHGGDLVPSGDLLAHCEAWGISANEAAGLLTGSSPATVETAVMLRLRPAPSGTASRRHRRLVDDVRALSSDARAAVDAWLDLNMWRTVSSDDVDWPTLAEVPALQLAALLGATERLDVADPDDAAVRAAPAEDRASSTSWWPKLATDIASATTSAACAGTGRAGWCSAPSWKPGGACTQTEACTRLRTSSSCSPTSSTVCCSTVRCDTDGPSADELAERAAERDRIEATPRHDCSASPRRLPTRRTPKAMARATAALMANLGRRRHATARRRRTVHRERRRRRRHHLPGAGVRGARPCSPSISSSRAMCVTPFTGPSVNSLLPVIGALVVEEGGAMCHAAVVREFGLAAVIGAHGATTRIAHGAHVEVDPKQGTVRLL